MSRSAGEAAIAILLQPLSLMMLALVLCMLFMVMRAATACNGSDFGGRTADGGKVISVKATFAGVRGMPPVFAVATNSANPLFAIGPRGLEYRVLRTHKRSFADIEQIDVQTAWRTVNIEVLFRGDVLTLAVNVGTEATARATLALFPAATPMTIRARMLLIPSELLLARAGT
jgi:hypothetical protein